MESAIQPEIQPEIKQQQETPVKPAGMKKETKILLITIMAVAGIVVIMMAAIFLPYLSPSPYVPPAKTPITPVLPVTPVTPVTPVAQYDDSEFLTWLTTENNVLRDYTNDELDALNNGYWYTLESKCSNEESYIDDTLKSECNSFTLSYQYDGIRDEFYNYLSDRSWAAFYVKWAASDMQDDLYSLATDNFNQGTDYTEQATAHLNTMTALITSMSR
jgi:hypothetical protein